MNVKNLLPIGSIVLLKGGEKRLMISGILQRDAGKNYDYIGLPYPEGYIGRKFQYLFNAEDIQEIIFLGYEDPERTAFLERIAKDFER